MEDPLPVAKTVSHHLQTWCGKSCVDASPAVLLPHEGRTSPTPQLRRRTSPTRTQPLPPRRHQAVGQHPQLGLQADTAHVEHLLLGLWPPGRGVAPATWYIRCSKWRETQAERKSHFYSCSAGPALGNTRVLEAEGMGGAREDPSLARSRRKRPGVVLTLQDLTMMIPEFL